MNDHSQYLKTLIEISIEYNRSLVLIFVDFWKTFDTEELLAILKALKECRIDHRYSNIIQNISEKATTTTHFHILSTERIEIKRGIKQSDVMLLKLFMMVLEYAFKTLD